MQSNLRIVVAAVLVVGLCMAGSILATDFVWDGEGAGGGGGSEDWTNPSMWDVGSSYPLNTNDNATIDDPSPTGTCVFDDNTTRTVNDLTLEGVSPTHMVLKVVDTALAATNFYMKTYGDLDADNDFTVDTTAELEGRIWVDVANSKIVDLGTTVKIVGSGIISDGISCYLDLEDNTSGELTMVNVTVDAEAGDAIRGLKLDGANSTMKVTGTLTLKSKQDSSTKRATLWVANGSLVIDNTAASTGLLSLDGGGTNDRRAVVDVDATLTAENVDIEQGYVAIDVASGLTFKGGDVTFKAGSYVAKSGSGTFRSGT